MSATGIRSVDLSLLPVQFVSCQWLFHVHAHRVDGLFGDFQRRSGRNVPEQQRRIVCFPNAARAGCNVGSVSFPFVAVVQALVWDVRSEFPWNVLGSNGEFGVGGLVQASTGHVLYGSVPSRSRLCRKLF